MSSDVAHFYVRRSESPVPAAPKGRAVGARPVGGALGGATYDIRTGRVIAWRDGQRIEPSSP